MIRAAGSESAGAVAELEAAAAAFPWPVDAIGASLAQPTSRLWLAIDGERPVGHLLASVAGDTGEVLTLAVHPDARRRGWARRLLEACQVGWAEEAVAEAFLEVRAGNGPAIALYLAAGWAEVGRRPRYYPDGEDALILRWEPPC